jgi:hypothetical protein
MKMSQLLTFLISKEKGHNCKFYYKLMLLSSYIRECTQQSSSINHERKDQLKNPMDQELLILSYITKTQDPQRVYHSPTPKRHFLEYDILKEKVEENYSKET